MFVDPFAEEDETDDGIRRYPTEELEIALLDGQDANPNEMKDDVFSKLVEGIAEKGFLEAIQVVGPAPDGRYTIIGGHHRVKAAKVLQMSKIPALVIPPDEFSEDEQKVYLVRMNILRGDLNPQKFTDLFNELARKYDVETTRAMMAFTKTDAFNRVYLDAKKALPPEMAAKLEEVRDELKTVDQLSIVLNRLFSEYGNTLEHNYMFFNHGGKQHVMVQMAQPAGYKRIKQFLAWCMDNDKLADEEFMARIDWPKDMK